MIVEMHWVTSRETKPPLEVEGIENSNDSRVNGGMTLPLLVFVIHHVIGDPVTVVRNIPRGSSAPGNFRTPEAKCALGLKEKVIPPEFKDSAAELLERRFDDREHGKTGKRLPRLELRVVINKLE